MKCPNCNTENDSSAAFCETCGTSLQTASNCPYCYAPVQGNGNFCLECGHRLNLKSGIHDTADMADLRYEIQGSDLQFVSFKLKKNQKVIAQTCSLMFMDDNVKLDTSISDGSDPNAGFWGNLWSAGQRLLTGESFFLTHYMGTSSTESGQVAFSAPYPGKIVPIVLGEHSSAILCQRGAFLAASYGTKIEVAFTTNLAAGFLGGEGFILQRLIGKEMAFVHSCGTIVEIPLKNQTIRINPGCIVAFEESIHYSITPAGSFTTMLFGTRTIFLATLSGTGSIWLQSMPFNTLANRICTEGINQGLFAEKSERK